MKQKKPETDVYKKIQKIGCKGKILKETKFEVCTNNLAKNTQNIFVYSFFSESYKRFFLLSLPLLPDASVKNASFLHASN